MSSGSSVVVIISNLWAEDKEGIGGGRALILNEYSDVVLVPKQQMTSWNRDPWTAMVRDGKLCGRGALDMKCGNTDMILKKICSISLYDMI